MKKRIILVLTVVALVLEILPCGAVLNFANPESGTIRKTYSYFDLTPYGYANFGPFITAMLTCALLILSIVFLFKNINKTVVTVSVTATITSLMPLLYGFRSFSAVGVAISIILFAIAIISVLNIKR